MRFLFNWIMPGFCSHCKKIGHYVEECRFLNYNGKYDDTEIPKRAGKTYKKDFVQVRDGRPKQGNNVDDPIVVEDVNKDKGKAVVIDRSPGVAGTNKNNKEKEVLQANGFEVLNANGDDQQQLVREMKEAYMILEDELNNELDKSHSSKTMVQEDSEKDDDTQDTDFVDATQFEIHADDRNLEVENNLQPQDTTSGHSNLLEIEKQNKAFLDQSWANIAKSEATEQRMIDEMDAADLPETHNNKVFQVVQRSKTK